MMMKHYYKFFISLLTVILLFSCTEKDKFPSPLKGLKIDDVYMDADEKSRTIEVKAVFGGQVSWEATDSATNDKPTWLKDIKLSNGKIEIQVEENVTINNRCAQIVLFTPEQNANNYEENVKVYFKIIQSRNKMFDGLDMSEISIPYSACDTLISLGYELSKAKIEIKGVGEESTSWCKASLSSGQFLKIHTDMYKGNELRQALVRMIPTASTSEVADSLIAHKAILITQHHNEVFDSLTIEDRVVGYDQKTDTVRFEHDLKDISCQIIDDQTTQVARWIKAKHVGKELIFYDISMNKALDSRNATVTLYLLDGSIEKSTVKTTFKVTQEYQSLIISEDKNIETDHTAKSIDLHVKSNAKYQIEMPGDWVKCILKPADEYNDTLTLNFSENITNQKREGDMRLLFSGQEAAKIHILQKTNPKIVINFADQRKEMSFQKSGGEFNLPIKTLTPDFKITKKASWISLSNKTTEGIDQYYYKVSVPYFAGDAFERLDTIVITTFGDTVRFPIKQHKYIYLTEAKHELEEGDSFKLDAKTNLEKSISWSSSNSEILRVSTNGLVKSVNRGTRIRNVNDNPAKITVKASIGEYDGVADYFDYCEVTVFIPADKVGIKRGGGNYEKTDNKVTSDCPVTVTNNYSKTITLQRLYVDGVGALDVSDKENETSTIKLKAESSLTFSLPKQMSGVSNPQVTLTFTVNGKEYTKKVNY